MALSMLITDSKTQTAFIEKINEIRSLLVSSKNPLNPAIGLMGQESGKALFLAYHYQFTGNKNDLDQALDYFSYVSKFANDQINHKITFSSGITGFGWLLQHIQNVGIFDLGADSLLDQLDEMLFPFMLELVKQGNYDFLHGAIGIGVYYLSRPIEKVSYYLETLIIRLEGISVQADDSVFWYFFDYSKNQIIKEKINLGLAHGLPSILMFFIKCHQKKIKIEATERLGKSITKFIIQQKYVKPQKGSFFPNLVLNSDPNIQHSRLAWCYGDLSLAYVLYCACVQFDDKKLKNSLLPILHYQTTRRPFQNTLIDDAGFCHGSSGVAFLFNKMYNLLHDDCYKQAALHWYKETFTFSKFNDGLAGYKSYKFQNPIKWVNDPGLLEGVAGIGLSMLSAISDREPNWAEAFMLQ